MSVSKPDLETALAALGNAYVLHGDPATASGLTALGAKEGEASVDWGTEYHDLTFPEQTGPALHGRSVAGHNPRITIPLVIGSYSILATLDALASADGGHEAPQPVVETSLVLVPFTDFGDGPWGYATSTWSPQAPVGALWFWRGHFERPGIRYRGEDGKWVEEVIFQAMQDLTKPEGQQLWTLGDPAAKGITIAI